MRITENTPARLTLRDRTYWIAVLLFAVVTVLIAAGVTRGQTGTLAGSLFFLVSGLISLRSSVIVFDKFAQTCEVRRLDIIHFRRIRLAFADIVDVRVEPMPSGCDLHVVSCRLSLVTCTATLPLAAGYSPDMARHDRMRDAILDVLCADRPRPPALDPAAVLARQGDIIGAAGLLRAPDGMPLRQALILTRKIRNPPAT